MRNQRYLWAVLPLLALATLALSFRGADGATDRLKQPKAQSTFVPTRQTILQTYARLPLYFEANEGQTDPEVKFLSRGHSHTLFLTSTEAVFALYKPKENAKDEQQNANQNRRSRARTAPSVLHMKLVGAAKEPRVVGLQQLPGKSNYLLGNDPKRWHTNIASYAQVKYEQVYPGVDLVFHGRQHQLEYDFELGPGADPRAIRLMFDGAEALRLDERGDLVMGTAEGEFRQHAPLIYQRIDGERHQVSGGYTLEAGGQVAFRLGAYDPRYALTIDPTLSYSTYLGGNNADEGVGIAVDASGSAYVVGATSSVNFPTTPGSLQTTCGGCPNEFDAFVVKLAPTGSTLVYSTYLGGRDSEEAVGIALDSSGNAYITGDTFSPDFPTTPGAFQSTLGGGLCGNPPFPCPDAFVTKLDPSGSTLLYSTYLGGSKAEFAFGLAVDSAGSAYVVGSTSSTDFPTTPGAFQTTFGGIKDAFVTKLDPSGSTLVFSTYLGGSDDEEALGIAVDSSGNVYVTGDTASVNFPTTPGAFQTTFGSGICFGGSCPEAFVTKLDPTGSTLVYSTYLGHQSGNTEDEGVGIAIDGSGNAYISGATNSANFPTTPGAFQTAFGGGICGIDPFTAPCDDAFVTKLNPAGSALVYSTYLGGNNDDQAHGIVVDALGSAYVTGSTASTNFPTAFPLQATFGGGPADAFVSTLTPSGSGLLFSTFLGGSNDDLGKGIALDSAGNLYVTGTTNSPNFPTTPGAFQTTLGGGTCLVDGIPVPCPDAFAVKLSP